MKIIFEVSFRDLLGFPTRHFPCSLLYWASIRTTSRQGCLPHLPGGLQDRRPPPTPQTPAIINGTKIGHKTRYKRVICSSFVCIMLLNTLKRLFVLSCLLCFDSRKADGERTGFSPTIALNSNTIEYIVSPHAYQVTDQFYFNLVYLIYHTSWSVSLKKYVKRFLLSTYNCLQFMP